MNESHKELLRQVQKLFQASERSIVATCCDRFDRVIDSCLTMGGTATSSSTSAGTDGSCVAEVPAPASFSSDASLVVPVDVEDLATPTPARCSIEGPSRDTTELRSASAPAPPPATTTATVDLIPVLAAPAASDGTLDGEAISGVAETPTTCSMFSLPRHPVASSLLVASSPPTPIEYVFDTNILVAAVPSATADVFSPVLEPTACTPAVQMQQIYNDSELFMPTSSQHVTLNVPIHRPIPWPSFMSSHADGDETQPLPSEHRAPLSIWLMLNDNGSTSYGFTIGNVLCSPCTIWCWEMLFLWFQRCLSVIRFVQQANENFEVPPDLERHITGILLNMLVIVSVMNAPPVGYALSFLRTRVVEEEAQRAHPHVSSALGLFLLPWPSFKEIDGCESPSDAVMKPCSFGNIFTSTGCIIINDMCISSELRCLDEVLLFLKYWWSTSGCMQSVQATFVWPPCSITQFKWHTIRSIELKLLSNGSMPFTLWTVLLDSGKYAALIWEYLGVDVTYCVGSWLIVAVCQESVQSSSDYYIAREIVSGNSLILNPRRYCMMVVSNSAFIQLAPAWDSRQHVSYDQLFGAFQNVSDWPGNFVTSDQMQVNDACSTWQLFLSDSSICLILVRAKEPYDAELSVAPLAGTKSVYRSCYLQCVEAYCPSFSGASKASVWEGKKLELTNWVSYMVAQYIDQCPGISLSNEGSCRFEALVLSYVGFPAVCTQIQDGCDPSFICDASYSREVELYMAAKELLRLQDGMCSWADSKNRAYTVQAWLSYGFVLRCLPDVQLLPTWPPPVAYCSITRNMFSCPDLSFLAICEVWLLNHLGTMLIGWPPRAHELPFLMQAVRGLLFLQIQDSDNGVVVKKRSENLVLLMEVPWNPGGSVWHWWLSTCYGQDPSQGGRHAIALTTFFKQVSAGRKYYLDSEDASGS